MKLEENTKANDISETETIFFNKRMSAIMVKRRLNQLQLVCFGNRPEKMIVEGNVMCFHWNL